MRSMTPRERVLAARAEHLRSATDKALVVYIIFQRQIIRGLSVGAVN